MASFLSSLLPIMPMLLLTTLLFLNMNKVVSSTSESLSFSFPEFVPQKAYLLLQADAVVTSTGKLQLTKVHETHSMGRALYASPFHIWDSKTGNVASFTTSFSFIINKPDKSINGDGFAFFLAPVDTQPQNSGPYIGLFPNKFPNTDESKSHQIVAVEFDTFLNSEFDPKGLHIGIDVNSIESVKTTPWDLVNGEVANVFINYQASTKVLTASLVYPSSQASYVVSCIVDIKNVLPEFVRVGFSATSGWGPELNESHDVLSWSFESKLLVGSKTCPSKNVKLVQSEGPDSSQIVTVSCE